MQLIGYLDSPYVRRVAIAADLMGIPFEHRELSVFRDFDEFRAINPLVKVPTWVLDDATVLVESALILDHLQDLAPGRRRLMPTGASDLLTARRLLGAIMVGLDKAVGIVYEREQRPAEKRSGAWIERLSTQLCGALNLLDAEAEARDGWLLGERMMLPDLSLAVAWTFVSNRVVDAAPAGDYPALEHLAARAEASVSFKRYPFPLR